VRLRLTAWAMINNLALLRCSLRNSKQHSSANLRNTAPIGVIVIAIYNTSKLH